MLEATTKLSIILEKSYTRSKEPCILSKEGLKTKIPTTHPRRMLPTEVFIRKVGIGLKESYNLSKESYILSKEDLKMQVPTTPSLRILPTKVFTLSKNLYNLLQQPYFVPREPLFHRKKRRCCQESCCNRLQAVVTDYGLL